MTSKEYKIMKINYLAAAVVAVFASQANAASYMLTTKVSTAGLTVKRVPNTAKVNSGTTVTLTAQGVKSGYVAKWSGVNCNNGLTCSFTMSNAATTVTVSSVKAATSPSPQPIPKYSLKVSVLPSGAGTVTPASGSYEANSTVIISQSSNTDYTFVKWSDTKCNTFLSCRLVISQNTNLTANFVKKLAKPTINLPVQNKTDVKKDTRFTLKSALQGASQYELVVFKDGSNIALNAANPCQDLDASLCHSVKKTTYPFDVSTFLKENGTKYQWRVRGIDTNGIMGNWSDARNFTMVGAGLDISEYVKRMVEKKKIGTGQCVALARHYATDQLNGIELASSSNQLSKDAIAKDQGAHNIFVNSVDTDVYKKVTYQENLKPSSGDIIFFNPSTGNKGYGHVAIVIGVSNDATPKLILLEQNYCTSGNGNGLGDCAIKKNANRSFAGVAGWLHIIKK